MYRYPRLLATRTWTTRQDAPTGTLLYLGKMTYA
jgi:hypothetical protein